MRSIISITGLLCAPIVTGPALAQTAEEPALAEEVAALRAEVEALRAELRALRDAAAPAPLPASSVPAPLAAAQPPTADDDADTVAIDWRGAPRLSTPSGWSFKPRGRIQIDAGHVSAPDGRAGSAADGLGFTTGIRRAYLGADGTIPGGLGYRFEIDLADNQVEFTDTFVTYEAGPVTITAGNQHLFTGLDQMTSDLFTSFTERAAFVSAFNVERRLGVSARIRQGDMLVDAGVFSDDISSLNDDGNDSISFDGRAVWMPKFGNSQLHVAGAAHHRDLGGLLATEGQRYRTRPYLGTTDVRFVDTGVLPVEEELMLGAELAFLRGPFHLSAEAMWLNLTLPGAADPTFFGAYAEAGMFLTPHRRGYEDGEWTRSRALDGGDWSGAVEINVRYDHLDLTDAGVQGGNQDAYGAALAWTPLAYLRLMANYVHLTYDIPGESDFNADTVAVRAQLDF